MPTPDDKITIADELPAMQGKLSLALVRHLRGLNEARAQSSEHKAQARAMGKRNRGNRKVLESAAKVKVLEMRILEPTWKQRAKNVERLAKAESTATGLTNIRIGTKVWCAYTGRQKGKWRAGGTYEALAGEAVAIRCRGDQVVAEVMASLKRWAGGLQAEIEAKMKDRP
jgi:hypothetical protein